MPGENPSQTELELTVSLLNAALESTADGILVVDRQGRIVKFNSKFAAMWRLSDEVLASRDDDRAIATVLSQLKDPQGFLTKVRHLYSHPEEDSYDLLEFVDGRYFERYSQPQRLGDQIVGRVWSFRDVTVRKNTEKALLDSRRQLEEFVSIAAHELRTPLTSLRAQIQLVNRLLGQDKLEGYPREKLVRLVRMSNQEIARFSELIGTLLDVARISARRLEIRPGPTELSEIVRHVIDYLEPQLRAAGCETRLEVSGPIQGHWDRFRMEQVLINLLSNAMKFGQSLPIDVSVAERGGEAIVHVRDQGIGISKEDQARIFERFERAGGEKSGTKRGGLGLGLFIAREIVQAHGGSIRVASEPGKGSDFEVRLPLSLNTGGSTPGKPSPRCPSSPAGDPRQS